MAYQIDFLPSAARQLEALARVARPRVVAAIAALADDPRPTGAKLLEGVPERVYRIAIGDIRVLYQVLDGRLVVLIVRIADRREVYSQTALSRLRRQLRSR